MHRARVSPNSIVGISTASSSPGSGRVEGDGWINWSALATTIHEVHPAIATAVDQLVRVDVVPLK
jgi:hypothetical protein